MVLASSSLHASKKVKVLLFLLWIAASTNEEGFHVGPALPSPASAITARYPLQLDRLEKCG